MKKTVKAWIFLFTAMIVGVLFPTIVSAETYAWPVPFVAARHSVINFSDLPGEGTLKIFTVTGEQIFSLTLAPGQTTYPWPVTTSDGKKAATGVYLFLVDGAGQQSDGKIVIIR